jgi:hypothetical protein
VGKRTYLLDGQFIAEFAIFVHIGDKDIERHALLPMEWNSVAGFIISRDAAFVTQREHAC